MERTFVVMSCERSWDLAQRKNRGKKSIETKTEDKKPKRQNCKKGQKSKKNKAKKLFGRQKVGRKEKESFSEKIVLWHVKARIAKLL